MSRLVAWALRHRRVLLLSYLLLALAALPGLARLEVDNAAEQFYPEASPMLDDYRRLEASFGSTTAVRFGFTGKDLFAPLALQRLADLERALAALPDVASVDSVLSHHRRFVGEPSTWNSANAAALRGRAAGNALDRASGLVGRDAEALSIVATLQAAVLHDAVRKRQFLGEAEVLLRKYAVAGTRSYLVGLPVLDRELNRAAGEVGRRFLPLLVTVVFILLLFFFRGARQQGRRGKFGAVSAAMTPLASIAPFALVAAVAAPLFGAVGWCGVRLNLVLAILPPVVFAITVATALHLLIRCRSLAAAGSSPHRAILATYREKGRAVLYTTASTVTGFLALATTPVGPIRALGLWGAGAMLFAGVAVFLLLPALLELAITSRASEDEHRHRVQAEARLERFGRRTAELAMVHRRALLFLFAATALAAVAGVPRIRVESNALHYFPPDHALRQAFEDAEARGIGLATIELLGEAPAGTDLASAESLAALARLGADLRQLPGAISAVTVSDLLDDVGSSSPLARAFSADALRALLLPLALADREGERTLRRFLDLESRRTRISLFVPTAGYEAIDPLRDAALARARTLSPGVDWRASGELGLLLATQHRLLGTLARSLAVALPAIALLFALMMRELRGALLALLPNLWPLLLLLGGMGWAGIPVDLATVMVASIVAGLVVDDTIHTLASFGELRRRLGAPRAVAERLEKTTPAFVVSGLVLAAGFGVCGLSSFAPIARFGLLSMTTLLVALAADLLLVPALFGGESRRG